MKKHYISPEVICQQIHLDSLLDNTSVTVTGTEHPIDVGGEAQEEGSDSRLHYDIWADEEEEEEEYEF